MANRRYLCALALAALPLAAPGAVYKCEVNGRVAYQDHPCAGTTAGENQLEMHGGRLLNADKASPSAPDADPQAEQQPAPRADSSAKPAEQPGKGPKASH